MIANFMFSFIVTHVDAIKEHQHETYQISFSIDHPSSYIVNKKVVKNIYGIVINSNTNHSCKLLGSNTVVSFIYQDSVLGKRLKALLNGEDYHVFATYNKLAQKVLPVNYNSLSPNNQGKMVKRYLLDMLYPHETFYFEPVHPRVELALAFIEQNQNKKITANEVAAAQYISTVWLQHIFKAEIGMPIGRYMLWKRIKKVIMLAYFDKMPLSIACTKYNFPDQTHFNHMFLNIFGVPPNAFLKSSILIF